jgi:type IV pilus assembly protein PilM
MIRKWFNSKSPSIGIDFGRSSVKLAQVSEEGGVPRLTASATVDVPEAQRSSSSASMELFQRSVEAALSQNGFRGRRAVLGLPASSVHIDRIRLAPNLDEEQIKQALQWETIDRLPFHPSRATLRHLVAGVVYENDEPRSEVIVMAVRQEVTERLLAAAAKAKLDVVGLRPEPVALFDAFGRCKTPGGATAGGAARAIVDIGHGSTRLYIAAGRRAEFARSIGIGRQHLDSQRAGVGLAVGNYAAAEAARVVFAGADADADGDGNTATALLAPADAVATRARETGVDSPLGRLVNELSLSLHYHAETFPTSAIREVVFVGGASRDREVCRRISSALRLPARAADPLAQSGDPPAATRPEMAVAISLSLAA